MISPFLWAFLYYPNGPPNIQDILIVDGPTEGCSKSATVSESVLSFLSGAISSSFSSS